MASANLDATHRRLLLRANIVPLAALVYLLVVLIVGKIVTHYYSDSIAVLSFISVAVIPGLIALLMWWSWRGH
ncbi:MAG TPA: hypothetical protein VKB73_13465 [Gaiellaceae bacterium]|nr:hypothetical protein [Gaiellaceae bacterium]